MSALEALILGIVQGLAEFLPISSSGHIEIGKALLGLDVKDGKDLLLFTIVVHAGTAMSTVIIFWNDIMALFRGLFAFKWNEETQYAAKIVVSMVPAALVGLMLKDELEALFDGQIFLVGCMLLVTGMLLLLSERMKGDGKQVSFPKAVLMGIAQAIAILPGISRSGATISTALLSGVERHKAAKFSFLMVLPLIFGATLLDVKDYIQGGADSQAVGIAPLVVGFIAAFAVGLVACRLMLRLVKDSRLTYFAIYCFIVGTIAIGSTFL